jgi:hypothetical protein
MDPQWNTPPDGDFARYVERLTAQAAQSRAPAQQGEHGLDVGMTPSPAAQPQAAARINGVAAPAAAAGASLGRNLLKGLGIAWLLILVVLLAAEAPLAIVAAVFAGGLWLAHKLRRFAWPPGVESWKQWVEEAAKKQQQLQQQRKRHTK